jgi:hypothetical protein|tara:strand:+ start:4001 stop:4801 length:801 start_codon:yes stop_codon:yes gene_type:complete
MKDFTREFDKIKALIVSGDPFAFSRFSDGEVTVLQNNVVVLAKDHFIQGDLHGDDVKHGGSYLPEEQKEFRPDKHESFQKKLVEAFKHRQYNYFKGIPPQNASYGDCSWKFCTELYGEGDDQHLSFSNLMINGNYGRFVKEIIPEFAKRKIVLMANENADLSDLPFDVKKSFTCGPNCMINDYYQIEQMASWIRENKIKNHTFLFAAATLSNYAIYELYKEFPENQYIDVGSSLGYHFKLKGCYYRHYLNMYWNRGIVIPEVDIWN